LTWEDADREKDFFLHPGLSPKADGGRGVVNATVNMITGFRKAGMKVLWTNVHVPLFPSQIFLVTKECVYSGD
jgi:nicotinamidase-related amidase